MQKRHSDNPPTQYSAQLFSELQSELGGILDIPQRAPMKKLCSLIEHDYTKAGLVGKGYHCLEHSLELSLLLLKALKGHHDGLPTFTREEIVEMAATAILHDYDPHASGDAPRVERTLHVLRTDEVLQELVKTMGLDIRKVSILIQRTDYPFTPEMEKEWKKKLAAQFPSEKERRRYTLKAELIAHFDKACTYYSLDPDKVVKRIEGLAGETGRDKDGVLRLTKEFLDREKVAEVAAYLPESYRERWKRVESYFQKLAGVKAPRKSGEDMSELA